MATLIELSLQDIEKLLKGGEVETDDGHLIVMAHQRDWLDEWYEASHQEANDVDTSC